MNQVTLVGKLDNKHLDEKGTLTVRVICETRVGKEFKNIELLAFSSDADMSKKIYESFPLNELVGFKGYIQQNGFIEIEQATTLYIK